MHRFRGFLLAALMLLACSAGAQTENTADTTVLQSSAVIDTVKHFYNVDSLDKAQKAKNSVDRNSPDLLKMQQLQGESDKIWMKKHIGALTMRNMHGRGYVKGGVDSAAIYILKRFKEYKLKPVGDKPTYTQGFAFPVNTFPKKMKLYVNGDSMRAGIDWLIEPSSSGYTGRLPVRTINLSEIADRAAWKLTMSQMDGSHAYNLQNVDVFCAKILNVRRNVFLALLPKGVYLVPLTGRLQWSVSRDTIAATVFYVRNDVLPKFPKSVSVDVTEQFIEHARSMNLVSCVPGAVKDSYIVISAHYDHLGMMGDTVVFPGASDNASGVAMMLFLANYYAKHTPKYTTVFIAFAGEEASLMGSEFFVKNPLIPLSRIRFVINLDVMGDASTGITVVNATEAPAEFGLLKQINDREKYVPEVRSRGPAANGDHYYFARAGVPAFFIYSNGGKGYYHDVYDRAKDVTANSLDGVAKLLISFTRELDF